MDKFIGQNYEYVPISDSIMIRKYVREIQKQRLP